MSKQLFKQVAHMDGTDGYDLVPFTAEEIALREAEQVAFLAERAEQAAQDATKAADKAAALAKLTALGLTAADLTALGL